MSRQKSQGTAFEAARKNQWKAAGVYAGRLAEGGLGDLGDLWIAHHPEGPGGDIGWVEECKAMANLNQHKTLAKAIEKAGHERVILSHKRLVDKGGKRRVPDGVPTINVTSPHAMRVLLRAYLTLSEIRPDLLRELWGEDE